MDLDRGNWRDDPILVAVFDYWRSKCSGRAMPARADIDPLELGPKVLPFIALTEAIRADGRTRFRFRLAGTALTEAAGLELAGQYVDTLNPNKRYAAYIEGLYRQTMETKRPVFSTSLALAARSDAFRVTRRLMCPLSVDGATVDMFITGQTFEAKGAVGVPTLTYADTFRQGPTVVVAEA